MSPPAEPGVYLNANYIRINCYNKQFYPRRELLYWPPLLVNRAFESPDILEGGEGPIRPVQRLVVQHAHEETGLTVRRRVHDVPDAPTFLKPSDS